MSFCWSVAPTSSVDLSVRLFGLLTSSSCHLFPLRTLSYRKRAHLGYLATELLFQNNDVISSLHSAMYKICFWPQTTVVF